MAHIAIMHHDLVERKRWISNGSFLHALSHCMILPGPEAQQLAIYIGWKLHGKRGGIVVGTLFVLPSMFLLLALSVIYVRFGNLPPSSWVSFWGEYGRAFFPHLAKRTSKKARRTVTISASAQLHRSPRLS